MNISKGFQIEDPPVFVPWATSQDELRQLLGEHGLRHITTGYFTVSCQTLGGMRHELGFHFEPRQGDRLFELEFFRKDYSDQKGSYEEFQCHFEKAFGPPTDRRPGQEGFESCTWNLPNVEIVHFVFDRFGPEEHMRVKTRDRVTQPENEPYSKMRAFLKRLF